MWCRKCRRYIQCRYDAWANTTTLTLETEQNDEAENLPVTNNASVQQNNTHIVPISTALVEKTDEPDDVNNETTNNNENLHCLAFLLPAACGLLCLLHVPCLHHLQLGLPAFVPLHCGCGLCEVQTHWFAHNRFVSMHNYNTHTNAGKYNSRFFIGFGTNQ